jgi:serine/threonine protein phosphatase PrpC
MKAILRTAAGNFRNQDRGLIFQARDGFVLCVADGAGGISGGEQAASTAIELIQRNADLLVDGGSCSDSLRRMDLLIADGGDGGERTCVLAVVAPERFFGASEGDTGAWFIPSNGSAN